MGITADLQWKSGGDVSLLFQSLGLARSSVESGHNSLACWGCRVSVAVDNVGTVSGKEDGHAYDSDVRSSLEGLSSRSTAAVDRERGGMR